MSMKNPRVSFCVPPPLLEMLDSIADADFRSRSSLVSCLFERGLEAYLNDGVILASADIVSMCSTQRVGWLSKSELAELDEGYDEEITRRLIESA